MASAKATTVEDLEESTDEAAAPKKRSPLLLFLAIGVLLLAATGGAAFFLMGHRSHTAAGVAGAAEGSSTAAAAPAMAPALYLDLSPAFVVNLADDEAMRFLQIDLEIMTRNQKVVDAAKDHMPRIRNALLMLFGQQRFHDLTTREAKEKLRAQALEEVRRVLQAENAPAAVEDVYFTSFVMQ